MDSTLALVVFIIAIALIFDFINGFHDAANSVATVVATQVLTPTQAVVWAAFFNFVAAFTAVYSGAAMARVLHLRGAEHIFEAVIKAGWIKTLVFLVLSPVIGLVAAYALM